MTLSRRKSKIEGHGLFTDTIIKKNELIGEFEITESRYETKFSIVVDDIRYRALGILKYSNHSSTPNARVDFPYMYAKRDIAANEEITWRYGE